jgi:tryptophan halogenase
LTSKYLRKIAEQRGIIRHEGKVVKINGHFPIESVEDDKGRTHKFDFVFDCSGFARLFIGKHFNIKWKDYTKNLTVDSTIPFFLPLEEKYPAYTHAIAMKYGWMFRVPTQKRYGSGYIYDSNLISKEQAIQEVEEKLGHKVELVNHFNFKSGTFEKTKVSNCISFGLSSGFLEPMAATNLSAVCTMLRSMGSLKDLNALLYSQKDEQIYNNIFLKIVEYSAITETFSHYVNDRNDTKFWNHYKNIENYPPIFRKAYEECFSGDKFEFRNFSEMTRFHVNTFITKLAGNEWFKEKAVKYYEKYNLEKTYSLKHMQYQQYIKTITPYVFDHREYLESL